jgi:hypothetical protein
VETGSIGGVTERKRLFKEVADNLAARVALRLRQSSGEQGGAREREGAIPSGQGESLRLVEQSTRPAPVTLDPGQVTQ